MKAQLRVVGRRRLDALLLTRAKVPTDQSPALRHRVALHAVVGIGQRREAVAEAHLLPVQVADAAVLPNRRRAAPTAVVLQAAVDVIGHVAVDSHVIELRQRQIGAEAPRMTAVLARVDAAVVAEHHAARVLRVDPQRVMIGVGFVPTDERRERPAAVGRDVDDRVQVVEALAVVRVDAQVTEVERPRRDAVVPVDRGEPEAAVGALQQRVLGRLQQAVDDLRIARGDLEARTAEFAVGDAVVRFEARPGVAAVERAMEARALPAAVEVERRAPVLPHAGEDLVGVARVEADVAATGLVVDEQDLLPRRTAVRRAVEAAFVVLAPRRAECSDEGDVRVGRVQHDAVHVLGLVEPEFLPRAAAVLGAIDAAADAGRVARVAFAAADPDDVRVALVDRDRADRRAVLVVEDRREALAAVGRLPHAAARGTDPDGRRVPGDRGDCTDASAHRRRADGACLQAGEQRDVEAFGCRCRNGVHFCNRGRGRVLRQRASRGQQGDQCERSKDHARAP